MAANDSNRYCACTLKQAARMFGELLIHHEEGAYLYDSDGARAEGYT